MSAASVLLGVQSAGGHFITDPRDIDRWAVSSLYYSGGQSFGFANGMASDHASTFWTTQPALGMTLSATAWAADAYKTLVDVPGRGFLELVIGPQIAGGVTSTMRITVDGIPYEISVTNQEIATQTRNRRQVLGALGVTMSQVAGSNELYESDVFDANSPVILHNGHLCDAAYGLNTRPYMLRRNRILELGQFLKFSDGLKVEMKVSAPIATGTATLAHNAGVRYRTAN